MYNSRVKVSDGLILDIKFYHKYGRAAWAEYYTKKAKEKGIPCIWWDNGAFAGSGELFGILDRRNLEWKYPEVVEALMKGIQ